MNKPKILVLPHFYYPDVASIGQLYTELCEGLSKDFEITVLCSTPNYLGQTQEKYRSGTFSRNVVNNVEIIRILSRSYNKSSKLSRFMNLFSYYKDFKRVVKQLGKFDLVMTTSTPPVFGGKMGRIAAKMSNSKLIYNIQDFNPEQIKAINYLRVPGLNFLLRKIDNKTINKADRIIIVSNEMKQTLINRKLKFDYIKKVNVISNWIDEKAVFPIEKNDVRIQKFREELGYHNDEIIVMYSGNLGLYYDLDILIERIKLFKDATNIKFLFVGDGAYKKKLVNYVQENKMNNVNFIPYQPKEQLQILLNSADIHLVVQSEKVKGVSFPSKLYGILATNKPIIAFGYSNGDLENILKHVNNSVFITDNNMHKIQELFTKMFEQVKTNPQSNGYDTLIANYSKNRAFEKYIDTIKNTLNEV